MIYDFIELGKVCKFVRGPFGGSLKKNIFVKSGYAVYEQQHAIYNQFNQIRYFIDKNKFDEMSRFEIFPNDLIMSCSGTMGKIAIVPNGIKRGIINQALLKLTPNNIISNKYLMWLITSSYFQKKINELSGGAAIQNVPSVSILKKIKIPLPPLPIQQKIVAKLDKIFAEIDKATAVVEINTRKIDDFFQSYLEKIYNNKYFAKKKISEIAKIRGGKRIPKGFNLKTEKTPYVYLRVKSFAENGEIDNSELRYVDAEVKNLIKNYVINSEDLYISIAGTIGRTGIVSKQLSGSLLTENACRLVFEKNINNKFVYYFTKSPSFKSQVIEQTRTTAQPKLALNRLGNIELIIPSLKEQLRIVESLDRISFFLTSSKNKYFSKINELIKLKQAILQQAFNGELVKAA